MRPVKPGDSITADELCKIHTLAVLERKNGDQKATAKTLGIDRGTLYDWLKGWGLKKGWFAKDHTLTGPPPAPPTRPATPATDPTNDATYRDTPTLL